MIKSGMSMGAAHDDSAAASPQTTTARLNIVVGIIAQIYKKLAK